MIVDTEERAVGVFSTYREVTDALNELRSRGYSMNKISVIGKDMDDLPQSDSVRDVHLQDIADVTQADEGAKAGAIAGASVGGLTGLLVGLGSLAIPGIGPVMLAGAAATTLATTVAGGALGAAAGSFVGALVGLGIPEENAQLYQGYITQGDYLILFDGTESEVRQAESILKERSVREWATYPITRPPTI
ncbi:MAG: signal transduction histidine kinase (STHK), LytS [Alkalinema sp. RU_4_3]|nr:signal transduction histidine kinase (STHK), LytS [Alkalinema sp. RU_4_3]